MALNPDQVWGKLDSFWRSKIVVTDADLIRYQTYASLIICANTTAKSQNFINAQGIATLEAFVHAPWFPIVVYKDQLSDVSYVTYGEGYNYDSPPEILYGDPGDPAFQYRVSDPFAEIPTLYDSVTTTQYCFDQSLFTYNDKTRILTFLLDPFTIVPSKFTTTGREYIVLWARNAKLDFNVPFASTGWTIKYKGDASLTYVQALRRLWELDVRGPNLASFKSGASLGAGFPVAERDGQVLDAFNDGYHEILQVNDTAYTAPVGTTPAVQIGDEVVVDQSLTHGVRFFDGLSASSATESQLPGIAFSVPLSSGQVVQLYAPNRTLEWSFDALRPSPWRFPLGGETVDVEAYWTDRNVDLSVYYPTLTPGDPVNPMVLLVDDLWKNALTVLSVDLADIADDALSFVDRSRLALSPSTYIVLQQHVADIEDSIDMSTAVEAVGYGYHAAGIVDTVSVSGTDLILSDYAPLVVLS